MLNPPQLHSSVQRKDIQGLRAIAVLAVLIYHLWPAALPGGYVGVDVFFVISGYLITDLLLREARATGMINLRAFYARRVRRLMPAAALVVTFAGLSSLILPVVQWPNLARDLLASTFYIQNWWLAHQSIDYLAQGHAPSLLQHYWSLSVEEQYYILWPLLMLFGLRFLTVLTSQRRLFVILIASLAMISLAYGVALTQSRPELAYFSTFGRLWELALGGLLAALGSRIYLKNSFWSGLVCALGLICIALSCVLFTQKTPFPGLAALLPTLGAALVLYAGIGLHATLVSRCLAWRPMQYVGDISYSLYLWHWPLIMVYVAVFGLHPDATSGFALLMLAFTLAHFTKKFIEEPFRAVDLHSRQPRFSAKAIALICFGAALLIAGILHWAFERQINATAEIIQSPIALAQRANLPYDLRQPTVPEVSRARHDNPELYTRKCHVGMYSADPIACEFGFAGARNTVVIVGDSHAAQWLPSLQALDLAETEWRIITHTKSDCPFLNALLVNPRKGGNYDSCLAWNKAVTQQLLALKPALVITSAANKYQVVGATAEANFDAVTHGLVSAWQPLISAGIKVVAIADTPHMHVDIPECMSSPFGGVMQCSAARVDAVMPDPISVAAESIPGMHFIDLTDSICGPQMCSPVMGQLLIWRDEHHLTTTFARYLAPHFRDEIQASAK